MKYSWPFYIPAVETDAFFEPAAATISSSLKGMNILASFHGSMEKPGSLAYVDAFRFADKDGVPFTLCDATDRRYLSPKYPAWVIGNLLSLGVTELTESQFLGDLQILANSAHEANFLRRGEAWHSQLARCLLPMASKPELKQVLTKIRIIPLIDGSWATAEEKPLMSNLSINLGDFPVDVHAKIVRTKAASEPLLKKFYASLGVEELTQAHVCQWIYKQHSATSFNPGEWTCSQLFSQARFMFDSSWRAPSDIDIWFATTEDKRIKGSNAYARLRSTESPALCKVLDFLEEDLPMIHPVYYKDSVIVPLELGSTKQKRFSSKAKQFAKRSIPQHNEGLNRTNSSWLTFLTKDLALASGPRLFLLSPQAQGSAPVLSNLCKLMFQKCPTTLAIDVLVATWNNWLPGAIKIVNESSGDSAKRDVKREALDLIGREIQVRTRFGLLPLGDTVVPGLDLIMEAKCDIPILDLHEGKSQHFRDTLHDFGVVVDLGIRFYIMCLKGLRNQRTPSFDVISAVYEELEVRYNGNELSIE